MRLFLSIPRPLRSPAAALLGFACAGLSLRASAPAGEPYSPPPFGHYQPILDRMPFGALPANFNAADPAVAQTEAQAKAEQQALAKKVNMSAVNVTPDGATAIGFTDLSVNPPVNYYVRVGDSAGGWTVLSADYDEELASIEKEGVAITLKLGQGLVDTPATNAALASARAPAPASLTPVLRTAVPSPAGVTRLGPPRPVAWGGNAAALRAATPAAPAAATPAATAAAERLSYAERLRERNTQKTQAQLEAEATMKEQFEKLARETAAREIKRREEEAALAAQVQAEQQPQEQPQEEQPQAQPENVQ